MQPAGSMRRQSSGRSSAAASPPAPTAVPDLLQQLRALGGMGQGKTYAGMAAAGRSSGAGYAAGSRDGRSAFFRPAPEPKTRNHCTPAAGSVTPPAGARAAQRFPTPDSAASPYQDDDILFQMSGLKPLRTASRLERGQREQQQQQQQSEHGMHRARPAPTTDSLAAKAAAAVGRSPPLNRTFSFAGEPSPPRQGAPLPTAPRAPGGARAAAGVAAPLGLQRQAGLSGAELEDAVELELQAAAETAPHADSRSTASWEQPAPAAPQPEAGEAAAAAAAASVAACRPGDAEAAEAEVDEHAAPVWSEELLNWMLSEKALLLVQAQRSERRQQELGAEVERLRARGASAEREVQRLLTERRALLDRVQRLSAAEAEASARAERLAMENDALAEELAHSQEVCREMLAARRAARDALADVSAHNCRLLAAYVEKKREAAATAEALAAHQRQSEAQIRNLEAQLRVAQAGAALGQLHSPPPSPPTHRNHASPSATCAAGEAASCESHPLHCQRSPPYGASYAAGTPAGSPQQGSPLLDKENQGGNWTPSDCGKRQQPGSKAAQWDDERSELLSLLERLQDQLSTHAEIAASARRGSRPPPRQHATPPPSPFCQAHFAWQDEANAGMASAAAAAAAAEEDVAQADSAPYGRTEPSAFTSATAQRSSRATSNLEASFDNASGSSATSEEASMEEVSADGASPAVAAHPSFDSQLSPPSVARSGAPSPPSVRPGKDVSADEQLQGEEHTPSSRPAAAAASLEEAAEQQRQPMSRARSSAGASQTLEAFFSPPAGSSPVPCATLPGKASLSATEKQERLQQAEQRTAELEAELQRLRMANVEAEERAAREQRRRAAEAAKAAGNSAFQAQRFEEAAAFYSAGLEAWTAGDEATLAAVLHCNRAAAHHARGRYLDALADCYRAESLDPSYARVYHRRADALWTLGAFDAAAQDLAQLLELGAGQEVAARLVDAQRHAAAQHPVNHYAVLGVKSAATPAEIKAAYKRLALVFHPDKASAAAGLGSEAAHAIFKLLSEAHRVLADAEARRHHDIAALRSKYRRFFSHAGL